VRPKAPVAAIPAGPVTIPQPEELGADPPPPVALVPPVVPTPPLATPPAVAPAPPVPTAPPVLALEVAVDPPVAPDPSGAPEPLTTTSATDAASPLTGPALIEKSAQW